MEEIESTSPVIVEDEPQSTGQMDVDSTPEKAE